MNERHRQKRLTFWRYLLAIPRSIYLNLRMLPIKQACRLPIIASHRTAFDNLGGSITINVSNPKIGLLKIGFSTYQQTHFRTDSTRLNLRGSIIINGESDIGAGAAIEVAEGGVLTLDDRTHIGPRSLIICHKAITFGPSTRCSWCCTLMDTDQHRLIDAAGRCCNEDRPIVFKDHVWIGCHATIAKGVHLPSFTTIGSGSVVHGRFEEERTVVAGNPAQVVKHGVVREDFC